MKRPQKKGSHGLVAEFPENSASVSSTTRLILRVAENEPLRHGLFGGVRGIRTLDTGFARITP